MARENTAESASMIAAPRVPTEGEPDWQCAMAQIGEVVAQKRLTAARHSADASWKNSLNRMAAGVVSGR